MDAETRQRMSRWEACFLEARTVQELMALDDQIREAEGFIFRAFVRDARIAARFARARNIEKVRLVADSWPDFIVSLDDREEAFEAVEADVPGRKRDEEYRKLQKLENRGESTATYHPEEEWLTPSEAADLLAQAASKKVAKGYQPGSGLVIYLNPTEYGIHHDEIVGIMSESTAAAKDSFESVWVLWKGKAYQAWGSEGI